MQKMHAERLMVQKQKVPAEKREEKFLFRRELPLGAYDAARAPRSFAEPYAHDARAAMMPSPFGPADIGGPPFVFAAVDHDRAARECVRLEVKGASRMFKMDVLPKRGFAGQRDRHTLERDGATGAVEVRERERAERSAIAFENVFASAARQNAVSGHMLPL